MIASIFLPAAGYGEGTSLDAVGSCGYIWSSFPGLGGFDSQYSGRLLFTSGYHYMIEDSRYNGLSIRPVQGVAK